MRCLSPAALPTALAAGFFCLAGSAYAFEDHQFGIYGEAGRAPHGEVGATNSATLGMLVPWEPSQRFHSGALWSYFDIFVSRWRAPPIENGHRSYAQIGAIATWRYRFDEGNSPWFAEAGIGVSLMDHLYRTPEREFSTAFQFTEVLGIGRSFGQQGNHEVSLRVQ